MMIDGQSYFGGDIDNVHNSLKILNSYCFIDYIKLFTNFATIH